jgi:hypothetical protein
MMGIQEIGAFFILVAMVIAFAQKKDLTSGDNRKISKPTALAVGLLIVVALVDLILWIWDEQTFSAYIRDLLEPFGFFVMVAAFGTYWWRKGSVEALEVMLGILLGHFFW